MADEKKREVRAFSGGAYMRVLRGIYKMAEHERKLQLEAFSTDDLRELFIKDWQRNPLTIAYELQEGGPSGSQAFHVEINNTAPMTWIGRPTMRFSFGWAETKDGFLVPMKWGWSSDHPAKLVSGQSKLTERFARVVLNEIRTSYEWGLVLWVYNSLNTMEYCSTPAQMRYIWAALVPILRSAGEDQLAHNLAQPSPRAGDKATAPPWILPYLKPTYDIVAKSFLLREVQEPKIDNGGVTYKLHMPSFEDGQGHQFSGFVPS